ncbi:DUF6573 family protein [Nocardia sp. NBC_01327]|uniref:DUF6573 family protein n=1 Tax=Nocardia sp. NBC_01327 TaxID=2903593 RepID=UPI002E1599A0|nr:hypothetical protein OG326_42410 [Nocardia sp. NBC_01327]
MFENAEIIHTYSRAQAIADGVLHDYIELAHEAGFRKSFVIAHHSWVEAVHWPEDGGHGQSETGRAWDVIMQAHFAIASGRHRKALKTNRLEFTVYRLVHDSDDPTPRPITLVIHIGPGDAGEPVFTVMAPRDE